MAIDIIKKLKRKNRILIVTIVILVLIITGMFVHRNEVMQNREYTIAKAVEIPMNTAYVSKRKIKKNEHNQFYKNRAGFF